MQTIHKPNYFLFTGGPGAGKTTVLNDLKHRGYMVVSEVARGIIKEQHAIGGNATHTGNRKIYCDLMLKVSIEDYFKMLPITEEVIFFDRGIPDLCSYSDRFCGFGGWIYIYFPKHLRISLSFLNWIFYLFYKKNHSCQLMSEDK